ncbi:nitroreductase/quinone reductase family protein [Streptomyces sp. NRAIS4]
MIPAVEYRRVIDEFRANGGRVGGRYQDVRLLLTTVDAGSGAPRTTPLVYLLDGADRHLVFATADGVSRPPAWLRDVSADPRAGVEDGVFAYDARAVVLEGERGERALARAAEVCPGA